MKEEINLPVILDNVGYNQKVLIFNCGKAYHLDGDHKGEWSKGEYCIESRCKNITYEYLANTYGKIESKEHMQFISELCDPYLACDWSFEAVSNRYFEIRQVDDGLILRFGHSKPRSSKLKQITIPLPPKQADSDEWPKVGDEVALRYRFDSKRIMYTGELLYLSSNHIIIKVENGNDCHCIRSEWDIEKPKTPEEDLREFLELLWHENNHDFPDFLDIAMKHIKKKPQ